MVEIAWEAEAEFTVGVGSPQSQAQIAWLVESNFTVDIPPVEGRSRVVVVDANGGTLGELEQAIVGPVNYALNTWDTASFILPVDDPKAHLVLDQPMREVQIWKGDQILTWGPMVRPQVAGDMIAVTVNGAMWHLSRRFVGKANRENHLCNPSFTDGLTCWNFLKTAYFLDYQALAPNDVRIYGPGVDGGNALEINSDVTNWSTLGDAIGPGVVATHTVVSGDTLWGIAKFFYGSGIEWWRIYNANQAQIMNAAIAAGRWNPKDPGHWIFPGQVFDIPGVPASRAVEPPPPPYSDFQWGEVFGYQEFTINGGERGMTVTMAGWVKIPSAEYEGAGTGELGITLHRMPLDWRTNNHFTQNGQSNGWGGARAIYTNCIERTTSAIRDGFPLDGWIRVETSLTVPPHQTEAVLARVSGVNGRTYWDRLTLTLDTAFERFGTDQSLIVADLVAEAQDPAFDKSDVNISSDAPASGVKRDLVALHSEHGNFWELITSFNNYRDGIDISMRYTPTDRTLVTHYPRRGVLREALTLQPGRNIVTDTWVWDGEAAASSVIVLGTGDGSDREEAAAIDETAFANGLIMERVHIVGPDTNVDLLGEIADEELVISLHPEILTVQTVPHNRSNPATDFLGKLWPGDTLPVAIHKGRILNSDGEITGWQFRIVGDYRVASMTLNEDDTLSLTLNRRDRGT